MFSNGFASFAFEAFNPRYPDQALDSFLASISWLIALRFPLIWLANKSISKTYWGFAVPIQFSQVLPLAFGILSGISDANTCSPLEFC